MMAYTITLVSPFSKFKTRAGMFWGPCFSFFPRTAWSATGTLHLCKMGHTCMGPNCLTKCWWSVAWPVLNPYSLPKQAEGPRGLRPAAWPRQALLSVGTLAWAPVGSSESDLDISLFLVHVLAFHDLGKLTSLVFQIDHSHSFLCPKVFSIEVPLFFHKQQDWGRHVSLLYRYFPLCHMTQYLECHLICNRKVFIFLMEGTVLISC